MRHGHTWLGFIAIIISAPMVAYAGNMSQVTLGSLMWLLGVIEVIRGSRAW